MDKKNGSSEGLGTNFCEMRKAFHHQVAQWEPDSVELPIESAFPPREPAAKSSSNLVLKETKFNGSKIAPLKGSHSEFD